MGALEDLGRQPTPATAPAATPNAPRSALEALGTTAPRSALEALDTEPRRETWSERAFKPETTFAQAYREQSAANVKELGHDLTQTFTPEFGPFSTLHTAWAALKTIGALGNLMATPVESAATAFVGVPFETVTGLKGAKEKIGTYASFAAQLYADPFSLASKAGAFTRSGQIGSAIEKGLSPTTRSAEARNVESLIRPNQAALVQQEQKNIAALEQFRKQADVLSRDQPTSLDFMRVMSGEAPKNPLPAALQPLAQELRRIIDMHTRLLQSLGYLPNAIADYWPRLWKDPTAATNRLQAWQAAQYAKAPLRGSRGRAGLMQRSIPTFEEGLQMGLEPVTYNPVEYALIRTSGMARWYWMTQIAKEMKAQPYTRFFRSDAEARAAGDFVRLNDDVFRVFLPPVSEQTRAGAKAALKASNTLTPAEQNLMMARSYGPHEMGGYYAPADAARVFNNFVSKSALEGPVYNVLRYGGNAFNMAQLGLSFFHPTMVSLDASVSEVARLGGLAKRGELSQFGKAAPSLAPGIGPLYTAVRLTRIGKAVRDNYLGLSGAAPQYMQDAENLVRAGGRITMDNLYHADASGGFMKAIKGHYFMNEVAKTFREAPGQDPALKALTGTARMAARLVETSMEPIMQTFVPLMKQGLFSDLSRDWMAAHPNAGEQEIREGMQTIWDSVENRMGQMTYDNVFWTKTLKDLGFLFIRAVGWNLGTIREIGGGTADLLRSANRTLSRTSTLDKSLSLRAQYTIALPIVIGLNGALVNYMFTGKGPETLYDYFFPRTGRMIPGTNTPERVSIPSYMKDWFSVMSDPGKTILNKLHPLWELGQEFYNNRYYYGGIIRDPKHGNPVVQSLEWMGRSIMPFSWRGIEREWKEGTRDPVPFIMSMFGFVPAATTITDPSKSERYQEMQDEKAWRTLKRQEKKGMM